MEAQGVHSTSFTNLTESLIFEESVTNCVEYYKDLSLQDFIQLLSFVKIKVKKSVFSVDDAAYSDISEDVHRQIGPICWAYAVATGLRAAESRIIGRKLKSHCQEVTELVERWGNKGANTKSVLTAECPKRRLRFRQVTGKQAVAAILKNRVVVFRFHLDDAQWSKFSSFFKNNPNKVLRRKDIGVMRRKHKTGHAMVICGATKDFWIVKNSWGNWADNGYCRIAKDAIVKSSLYDIFYYQTDLSQDDWENYYLYNRGMSNAKSIATVIGAAESRIIGRKSKDLYEFYLFKCEIFDKICEGQSMNKIMESECERRQLRFCKSDPSINGIKGEINENRPRIGVMELSEANWCKFIQIFINDNCCTLKRNKGNAKFSNLSKQSVNVIVAKVYGSRYKIKNPWGDNYKFIKLEGIFVELYDVFFYQHDLTKWDWTNFYEYLDLQELDLHDFLK